MQAKPYIFKSGVYDAPMPIGIGRPAKAPRSEFGERIAEARERAGLTQQQLADKLGTTQRVIAYWEREPVALRAEQLAALADALGVSADALLGREQPKARGNGPAGRAKQLLEQLNSLPRSRQQAMLDTIEALMAGQALLKNKAG